MTYEQILGMVLMALSAIFAMFLSFKKQLTEERKPIDELNKTITELNANFNAMIESNKLRDELIAKHTEEIGDLKIQAERNKLNISNIKGDE